MMLHETLGDVFAWDVSILASDISDAAVQAASKGRYAKHEIERGMPPMMLSKYFNPVGADWQVKDELRALICFEKRNLLDPFFNLGPFDIIFCRNVAIYFTPDTRGNLFNRLGDTLAPHGYLLVGSSESLVDLGPRFKPQHHCRATIYQPNTAEALAVDGRDS
jgi:chemotaxis protein methyltransferase CheR